MYFCEVYVRISIADMKIYTYRQKTLLLFLAFSSVTILSISVAFVYISAKNKIQAARDLIDKTHVLILSQNNTIADFLLYDLSDTLFYARQHSVSTIKQDKLFGEVREALSKFKVSDTPSDSLFSTRVSSLDSILNHQNKVFDSIVTQSLFRGFIDYGIEGEMRRAIHSAEQLPSANSEIVLTMRRHEKDYIIRRQGVYVNKLHNLAASYQKTITDTLLAKYLDVYLQKFNSLVSADKAIGHTNSEGLRAAILKDNRNLLIQTDQLKLDIDNYFRTKLKVYRVAYLGLSILLILVALYLSIIVSRKYTMRIIKLSKHIETYIESNFTSKRTLFLKPGNDEIGSLILNYGILKDKLALHLRNLEHEVDKRTQALKEQTEDIISGINYAKHIQSALLPGPQSIERHIPNHFVFFKPKAIVSGDFYWYKYLPKTKKSVIAVADCTGHGVPGALMSMLGIALLNDVVLRKNIKTTGNALNEVRKQVLENLFRNTQSSRLADGMDIALIAIDHVENTLQFSGANRPIMLVQNSNCTLIKGDKMPIGKHLEVKSDFKTHHIKLNDGDKIYLFTDGFADQFGGSGNKKYLSKRFVDFLKNLSETPPTSKQAETLADEFETWRTNNEQTDDVLVFGMQYTERMTEKKTVKHLYSLA